MEKLEKWLRDRPLTFSLLLALVVAYAITTNGVASEDSMPVGDGEHYAMQGLLLYGHLHAGQVAQFWETLTLPKEGLLLPHYLVFFLVPRAWASLTAYGLVQALTTYTLLAAGIWTLCRMLDRVVWAPALFLLCAAQNFSLDSAYFYFADTPFLAVGVFALAWQIQAWRQPEWRLSLLSGAGAGLVYWVKAPNAVLFTATYVLAEIIRAILVWNARRRSAASPSSRLDLFRHALAAAGGFLPLVALAFACGGFASIFRLLNTNEVSGLFTTDLQCSGLLRLLYFPLCLTYFYHALCLIVIFGLAGFAAFKSSRPSSPPAPTAPTSVPPFPALLFLPLLIAYLVLGEYFSFGMAFKSMRFLLILLPVFWLAIFWALERRRIRPELIFLAAAAYTLCAFGQILFNSFESGEVSAESYQLQGDWLSRLPPWHEDNLGEISTTRSLVEDVRQALPDGGKVAVGTEQLFFTSESLTWVSQYQLALAGRPSPYEFANFLTSDGKLSRPSLLGAQAIFVLVHPALQYSQVVHAASVRLVQYCRDAPPQAGVAQIAALDPGDPKNPLGYLLVFNEPMDDDHVTALIDGSQSVELPPGVDFGEATERPITWREAWNLIERWIRK